MNIIIGNRSERLPRLMKELETQGITDFDLWDGIYKYDSAKKNINAAHKQVIEYAKLAKWEMVCVGEEDLKFFAPGAWDFFIKNIPKDFDLYLSSVYVGDIKEDNTTDYFCGFGLYICHSRFYDSFLATDPNEHIDRSMKGKGRFVVSNPFIAEQWDGWSANTGKEETYGRLMQGRNIFTG